MNWDENAKTLSIFYVSGFLFILVGLMLMYNEYSTWSYEVIAMGIVFLLLGIDANRRPTN